MIKDNTQFYIINNKLFTKNNKHISAFQHFSSLGFQTNVTFLKLVKRNLQFSHFTYYFN